VTLWAGVTAALADAVGLPWRVAGWHARGAFAWHLVVLGIAMAMIEEDAPLWWQVARVRRGRPRAGPRRRIPDPQPSRISETR